MEVIKSKVGGILEVLEDGTQVLQRWLEFEELTVHDRMLTFTVDGDLAANLDGHDNIDGVSNSRAAKAKLDRGSPRRASSP